MLNRLTLFAGSSFLLFALTSAANAPKAPSDPIRALQLKWSSNPKAFVYEPSTGYLRSVLRELKIDPSSQTLVFSKTSLQVDFINPKKPRALYFNDHTYIGWSPGAPLLEVTTVDPVNGLKFYSLPNLPKKSKGFHQEPTACIPCHGGNSLIAQSVPTSPSGKARPTGATKFVTGKTPITERWGGWYVTGNHGTMRHQGNELAIGTDLSFKTNVEKGANAVDLSRYFNTKPYLTAHSDIVALMVMEHQMDLQNLISRLGRSLASDIALGYATELEEPCMSLVEALLCSGEAPLTSPVKGSTRFAEVYSSSGVKDSKGRSLKDLDLKTRLLKYPCSPLIYSASFDAIPTKARRIIWKQMKEVLTSESQDPRFKHLSAEDRQNILEILRDTKPEFAAALKG